MYILKIYTGENYKMKINRIIPSIMIMASGLAGCGEHAPRKVQTTLNSLMANKPVKEFIAIKTY